MCFFFPKDNNILAFCIFFFFLKKEHQLWNWSAEAYACSAPEFVSLSHNKLKLAIAKHKIYCLHHCRKNTEPDNYIQQKLAIRIDGRGSLLLTPMRQKNERLVGAIEAQRSRCLSYA
jgi:hypothetical protein